MEHTTYQSKMQDGLQVSLVHLQESSVLLAQQAGDTLYDYSLVTLLEGSVELVCDHSILTINAYQSCFYHNVNYVRTASCKKAKLWLLAFKGDFAEESLYHTNNSIRISLLPQPFRLFQTATDTFKMVRRLFSLLYKHSTGSAGENSHMICQLSFNLLLSCVSFEAEESDLWAAAEGITRKETVTLQFLRLVATHVLQHHDVAYYASTLCMTQGNLTKIVKRVMDKAPKALIEETLIDAAKKMLDKSSDTIYQLAEELGFKSSPAFINFFRYHTGFTPNEYRNRNTKA